MATRLLTQSVGLLTGIITSLFSRSCNVPFSEPMTERGMFLQPWITGSTWLWRTPENSPSPVKTSPYFTNSSYLVVGGFGGCVGVIVITSIYLTSPISVHAWPPRIAFSACTVTWSSIVAVCFAVEHGRVATPHEGRRAPANAISTVLVSRNCMPPGSCLKMDMGSTLASAPVLRLNFILAPLMWAVTNQLLFFF